MRHTLCPVSLDLLGVSLDLLGLACRLCAASKGISDPVRCWKQPENVICLRHERWTGNGSTADSDQPDLSGRNRLALATLFTT